METNVPEMNITDKSSLNALKIDHLATTSIFDAEPYDSISSYPMKKIKRGKDQISDSAAGGFVIPDSTIYTVEGDSAWAGARIDQLDPCVHGSNFESNREKICSAKVW